LREDQLYIALRNQKSRTRPKAAAPNIKRGQDVVLRLLGFEERFQFRQDSQVFFPARCALGLD
jgi:hypothetical protein